MAAIDAWRRHGRAVAVVSNNAATAVQSYLDARGIQVDVLVARTSTDPRLLKPDPYLVSTSMQALHADADKCALVGDSLSDIEAARRVGVISIGYANKPRKYETLAGAGAGADAVIDDMRTLADAAAVVTP
jgi:phosphoglycolate phosphatase